jgi:hypothetical protein
MVVVVVVAFDFLLDLVGLLLDLDLEFYLKVYCHLFVRF